MRAMMASVGIVQEGIVNFGDFKVSQRGAGANMSVDVAAGDAWIVGDNTARQGLYHVANDAVVNIAIPAAHATLPRIDRVVLRVYDSTVIGGEKDQAVIEVVSGTATSGATLSNLTGAPVLPSSSLNLGFILVPAAATKIETASIGNWRDFRLGQTGYPPSAAPLAVAGAPANYAFGRPLAYVPAAHAYRTAQIACANATLTPLTLNLEQYDLEEMHDLVSNTSRLTAKTPGFYIVTAEFLWSAATNTHAEIRKNGGEADGASSSPAAIKGLTGDNGGATTAQLRLGYGDYVEAMGWQTSGGSINFNGGLRMIWQGP
jgi:hypothetical protein